MNLNRHYSPANQEKHWYCYEFIDEESGHHSFSAAFTTLAHANKTLLEADRIAPSTMHIYYWRSEVQPFSPPPQGYDEGPLKGTQPQEPSGIGGD